MLTNPNRQIQDQFYHLLRQHANNWTKAQYYASKRNPQLALSFLDHATQLSDLAAAIKDMGRADFVRWLFCHQPEYLYLYFHLTDLYQINTCKAGYLSAERN